MEDEQAVVQTTKQNKLPFIITLAVIILLFSATMIYALFFMNKEDPDISITKLINENVKADAADCFEGYSNSKSIGYVLDDLLLSSESRVILWDSKNDCYVLYDGSELVYSPAETPSDKSDLWIFVDKLPESSPFAVYYVSKHTVETQKTNEYGKVITETHTYTDHIYTVTESGGSRTYTCTENGCSYSYTVKVAE